MGQTVRATPAARARAREIGIDLTSVAGTGKRGRIQKEDVELASEGQNKRISPVALAIAEAHKLDLSQITGSGYRGKIMKEDVRAELKRLDISDVLLDIESGTSANASKATDQGKASQTATQAGSAKTSDDDRIEEEVLSPMRKVIAKRMSESYLLAPMVTVNYEVDMTEAMALRKKIIDPILEATECKVSVTDLVAYATIKCLAKPEHKYINASLSTDVSKVIFHKDVNLALAVGFDGGLLTPVLYQAQDLKLSEVVAGLKDLAKRALANKLAPGELAGSTFTISSLGMFGVDTFNPIINQPNSAILGVDAIVKRPWVVDDQIQVRPIMKLSLTVDHRIIDGLAAAKFMQDLKKLLENPLGMLV